MRYSADAITPRASSSREFAPGRWFSASFSHDRQCLHKHSRTFVGHLCKQENFIMHQQAGEIALHKSYRVFESHHEGAAQPDRRPTANSPRPAPPERRGAFQCRALLSRCDILSPAAFAPSTAPAASCVCPAFLCCRRLVPAVGTPLP